MKVRSVKCPKCGDVIYSRTTHDFHFCSCKSVAIDGGFDYVSISAKSDILSTLKTEEIEINATKKELYDDWNYSVNKFGIIKGDSL